MSVRTRQVLFVALGLVLAAIMGTLGMWQAQRSIESGDAGIAARASLPPVALLDHVHPDGTFDDIYGKPVTVTGTYLPGQQVLVPASDGSYRVLTALQVSDGRVVPVVRGVTSNRDAVPAAPGGVRTETGLFLPGEADESTPIGEGELASVRMPLLAQRWPQQLTPGFVTLDAAGAASQGLAAASVTLPHGEKSLQNGSYALQWWLFSAFALGMGVKLAHGVGEKERRRLEAVALSVSDGAGPAEDAGPLEGTQPVPEGGQATVEGTAAADRKDN